MSKKTEEYTSKQCKNKEGVRAKSAQMMAVLNMTIWNLMHSLEISI